MTTISSDVRTLADAIRQHITISDGAFNVSGQAALSAARTAANITDEEFARVRAFELNAPKAFLLAAGEACNAHAAELGLSEVFLEMPFGAGTSGENTDRSRVHVTWRAQQTVPAGIPKKGEPVQTKPKYGVTTLGVIRQEMAGSTSLDAVRKHISEDMAARAHAAAAAAMAN